MLLQTMDQKLGKHDHYRSRLVHNYYTLMSSLLGNLMSMAYAESFTVVSVYCVGSAPILMTPLLSAFTMLAFTANSYIVLASGDPVLSFCKFFAYRNAQLVSFFLPTLLPLFSIAMDPYRRSHQMQETSASFYCFSQSGRSPLCSRELHLSRYLALWPLRNSWNDG